MRTRVPLPRVSKETTPLSSRQTRPSQTFSKHDVAVGSNVEVEGRGALAAERAVVGAQRAPIAPALDDLGLRVGEQVQQRLVLRDERDGGVARAA